MTRERTAVESVAGLQAGINELRARVASGDEAAAELRSQLEAERQAHAGTLGRLQELQLQLEQARALQQRQQEAFSADLARARGDIETAQERAAAAERRALMEIEQERQARDRADKAAENLRDKLSEAEGRERKQSLEHAEAATRSAMEINTKTSATNSSRSSTNIRWA